MREITAVMDETGGVSVSGAYAGFVEEHNAARLAVTLSDDFAGENYTGLRLCFDTGPGGRKTVTNTAAGLPGETPASREGATLFCLLERELTATGTLKAQVEALKMNGGAVEAAAKSQVFELFFRPSVTGALQDCACVAAPAHGCCEGKAGFTRCSPAYYGALAVKRFDTLYLVDDTLTGETPGDDEEEPHGVRVTSVSLNAASLTLGLGRTSQLTATVLPVNADNNAVVWSSSNAAVASVTGGLVSALAAGTAVITATTADGGFTASAALTVAALPGFWQGSKTVNGVTITVSGNTVTLHGTKTNADYASTLPACYTENVTNVYNADACPKWHTFAAGDTVTLKVIKMSGTAAGTNGVNSVVYMRGFPGGIVMAGATWTSPSGTWNYTFPADKDVGGLFGYLDTNAVFTNYTFTVELTVNSTRWL